MGLLDKLASIRTSASALGSRTVSETLTDSTLSGRQKVSTLAKMAGVRMARGAWHASGASGIAAVNSVTGGASRILDAHAAKKREQDPQPPAPSSQLPAPPDAPQLPAPTPAKPQHPVQSVQASTRANQEQIKQNENEVKARADERNQKQTTDLTSDIAADVHFIAEQMKNTDSPLRPHPFAPGGAPGSGGGGMISSLLDVFSNAAAVKAGKDLLVKGGGMAKNLGAKVLTKGAGILSKIPGLGKIGARAGGALAGGSTLASTFTKDGIEIIGKEAVKPAEGSLAARAAAHASEITDVTAKTIEKTGAETAAKTVEKVGGEAIAKTAGKAALGVGTKATGKVLLKKIPVLGALAGLGFGAARAAKGDWTGAGLETASGVASILPGWGTAGSVAIDAGLAARDISGASARAEEEGSKTTWKQKLSNTWDSAKSWVGLGSDKPATAGVKPAARKPAARKPAARKPVASAPTPSTLKGAAIIPPTSAQVDDAIPDVTRADIQPAVWNTSQESPRDDKQEQADDIPLVTRADIQPAGWGTAQVDDIPDVTRADIQPAVWNTSQESPRDDKQEQADEVFDLLDTFLQEALDPDRGIYIRQVEDTFQRSDSAFSPSVRTPSQLFASERSQSPRIVGAGTPFQRADVSALTYGGDGSARARPTANLFKPAGGKFTGFGSDVDAHISEAAKKYGMDEKVLRGVVKMEGGWNGAMSPTGAIGTGQFIQSTWDGLAKTKDGQGIGMSTIGNRFRTDQDPRRNKRTNTLATALLARQNAKLLEKAGIEPTGENLYMMHNIGPGVIDVLQGRKASASTILAMQQNGMKDGMTPEQFVDFQKKRFQSHYEQANAVPSSAQANGGTGQMSPSPVSPVKPVAVSQDRANAETLTNVSTRQQAPAPTVVVAPAPTQSPARRRVPGAAQGDTRPGIEVRNNESSIRRVSDSTISRTMT